MVNYDVLLLFPTAFFCVVVCLFCFAFLVYLFILFLAALGLCCCTQASSSCEQGLLFVAVCGLLTAVASLVEERGL